MTATALLDQADALLVGTLRGRNRMAAWVARAALEDVVRQGLQARGMATGRATMRSSLSCLESVAQPLAEQAEFAWSRLSSACHHHAFEMAPAASEVRALIDTVRRLADDPSPTP